MRDTDLKPFTDLLDAVCSLLSRGAYQPNATNTALWLRAMEPYSLEQVRGALDAHLRDPQRGRFVPTPADVIAQLQGLAENDGRPGAEEAWSIALRSRDERDTVVWTQEIAVAMEAAKVVLDIGDEVGARMAFREVYGRLVEEARRARMPVAWSVSLGFDADGRNGPVVDAVAAGRLHAGELSRLPGAADLPLLTLAAASTVPHAARQALTQLSEALRNRQEAASTYAIEREATREMQAEIAKQMQERWDALPEMPEGEFKAPPLQALPPGMRNSTQEQP